MPIDRIVPFVPFESTATATAPPPTPLEGTMLTVGTEL